MADQGGHAQARAPVRPWADVIDRIGVTLAASRDAATRPGELAKARRLADDAYWVEFESSDMETAVNKYLGYGRARELERQFHAISVAARDCRREAPGRFGDGRALPQNASRPVVGRDRAERQGGDRPVANRRCCRPKRRPIGRLSRPSTGPAGDPRSVLESLKIGLRRVEQQAERNRPDEAASELTTVYMTEFEPLERYLLGRSPQAVRPLEIQFNSLRGDLTAGLKGEELASRVAALSTAVETVIDGLETRPAGAFGPAFFASLVTILREGVEVILVVTMLLALVAKAATGPGGRRRPDGAASDGRAASEPSGAGDLVGRRAGRPGEPGDRGALERPGDLRLGRGPRDSRGRGDARRLGRAVLRELLADLAARGQAMDGLPQDTGSARPRAGRAGHTGGDGVSGRLSRRGRDLADVPGPPGKRGANSGRASSAWPPAWPWASSSWP